MNPLQFIKDIKELILDDSTSWGTLIAKFISLLALLFLVDVSFNFTYYVHTSNKLSQLEKIIELKSEYKLDSVKTSHLTILENDIFEKEHYSEFIPKMFSKSKKNVEEDNVPMPNEPKLEYQNSISIIWTSLSSNYILYILFPFLLFLPLYNKKSRTGNAIAGWISSIVLFVGMITIVTFIASQIPLIWNKPILNYILNGMIHTIFWGIIIYFANKTNANKS